MFLSNAITKPVLLLVIMCLMGFVALDAVQKILALCTGRSLTLEICVRETSLLCCGFKSGMTVGQ